MPTNKSSFPGGLAGCAALLALLLIAAIWFYRTPYNASTLEVPPDTIEYALAPLQFLETGRYEIMVEGRPLPPRYPPWFPVMVLLPAYVLFGHDPGNAILPVTVLAVAGVGFAWAIGRRLSAEAGGILAGLTVLFLPPYGKWVTQVMTDVPATALMLATCLLYLRVRSGSQTLAKYFVAGLLIAAATLFRPVFAAMVLPFLLAAFCARKAFVRSASALLLPLVVAAAATFAYNAATFGSPLRNGYKFWTAIPMDYPSLVFSLSYLKPNLHFLVKSVFPVYLAVCLVAWLIVRKREAAALASSRRVFQNVLTFVVLTTGPMVLFHLFYFYRSDRFYIPVVAGAAVIAGGTLGLLFRSGTTLLLKLALPVILILAIGARIAVPEPVPHRRLAADHIRMSTPDNAVIISAIEPVYLERLAGHGSKRRFVPLSRDVEYASKLVVPKRVDIPDLSAFNWRNGRVIELLRGGALEAIQFVASEQIEAIVAQAASGTPVFFDTTFVTESDSDVVNRLRQHFAFVKRAEFLYELRLR